MVKLPDGSGYFYAGVVTDPRTLEATYTRDIKGRVTAQTSPGTSLSTSFNAKDQVTQTISTTNGTTTTSDYNYGTPGTLSYALGQLVSSSAQGGSSQTATYTYAWYDGPVKTQAVVSGTGQQSPGTSTYTIDAFGQLQSVSITGGTNGTTSYTHDAFGQGIVSSATINGIPYNDVWHRMGGVNIWHMTNRYDPRGGEQDGTGARYTVRSGDTLASIALGLWGDASLWYKLAEANGLTAQSSLTEGQSLILPPGVWRNRQSAQTFRPYDPQAFYKDGDPSPEFAAPAAARKKGCGVFGAILQVIITVVVARIVGPIVGKAVSAAIGKALGTVVGAAAGKVAGQVIGDAIGGYVGGAAGSIAGQGFGVATGNQDRFSWKNVGRAATAGGVGGGVPKLGEGLANAILRSVLVNVGTQGLALATGLQKKFDFAGIAVAAGVGAVAHLVGGELGLDEVDADDRSLQTLGKQALTGMAAAIAGAGIRSLLKGEDFGDNIIATLPDVIGSTIGNAVGGRFSAAAAGNGGTTKFASLRPGLFPGASRAANDGVEGTEDIVVTAQKRPLSALDELFYGATAVNDRIINTTNGFYRDAVRPIVNYFKPAPQIARSTYDPQRSNYSDAVNRQIVANARAQNLRITSTPEYKAYAAQMARRDAAIERQVVQGRNQLGAALIIGPTVAATAVAAPFIAAGAGGGTAGTVIAGGTGAAVSGVPIRTASGQENSLRTVGTDFVAGASGTYVISKAAPFVTPYISRLGARIGGRVYGTAVAESNVARGLSGTSVVSPARAEAYLVKNGLSPDKARGFIDSFDGPITARIVRPGEDFVRYFDEPFNAGNFLGKTRFSSPSEAVDALALRGFPNRATSIQPVTSTGRTIVFEGGIRGGAPGVRQTVINNQNAFFFGPGSGY